MTEPLIKWNETIGLPWRDRVALIVWQMRDQAKVETPVEHIFAPGVYIREMFIPANTLFLGRAHRHGHLVQLTAGSVTLITPAGSQFLKAPAQVHTFPGCQMVVYTHEDIRCRTVHPNLHESNDTQALEDDIFEPKEEVFSRGKALTEYRQMFIDYGLDEEALRLKFEDNSDMIAFNPDEASFVCIKESPIHGLGLFATADFEPGDLICRARVTGHRTPAGRYTNHSFDPNAEFIGFSDLTLIARKRISLNEEILIDYRVLHERSLQ